MKKVFYGQFSENFPSHALSNDLPSLTVPDQSMTIQEIIAKFTRTGMLPESYLRSDPGGQEFDSDSEFDPLDHNPSEFDPKVHQDKLKALQTNSEPSGDSDSKPDTDPDPKDPES